MTVIHAEYFVFVRCTRINDITVLPEPQLQILLIMSDVLSLQKLNEIDAKTKLVVGGFVRKCQILLPDASAFYNIPPSIIDIILMYFYVTDEFDIVSDNIEMRNKCKNIVTKGRGWSCAYGKVCIHSESKIHCYWKVKLLKSTGNSFIGITNNRIVSSTNERRKAWQYNTEAKHVMYALFNRGALDSVEGGERKRKYLNTFATDKVYNEGDVITIVLNLEKQVVKYLVNDEEISLYHEDIKIGKDVIYYLAISACKRNQEMTIIKFGYV